MAIGTSGGVGRLGALFACGALGGKTDAELLRLFADGEAAEAAFEALVLRHGPDVLRACRRVLADPNDAEDAFQATFLVLARRAASGSIGRSESLGPWLHGVALRVARKARVAAARRRKHEGRIAARTEVNASRSDDLAAAIREEVDRLPEALRLPVVLCYLEDMTYQGAANRLRVSEGTIRGRLVKARSLLRSRLGRDEDVCVSSRPPRVPPALLAMTIRSASAFGPGGAGLASLPANLVALMEGVLTMTLVTRWFIGAFAGAAIALAADGGASLAARGDDKPAGAAPAAAKREPQPAPVPATEPDPARVLTLDDAIAQLLRNDVNFRAKWMEIPMARADLLATRFRAAPRQFDVNISLPLDSRSRKSVKSRPSSQATTIAEAQYLDDVRMRVDALYSAYVDVQEMHERIRRQKQWQALGGRLAIVARDLQRRGLRPEPDGDVLMQTTFHRGLPVFENQGDQARHRRRALGQLIGLGSVAEADRLHVEPITPVTSLPPASVLVRLALSARPDLVAIRLGVKRAEDDLQKARDGLHNDGDTGGSRPKRPDADTANVARARLNIDQAHLQLVSREKAITREVEQLHDECASSLRELEDAPFSPRRASLMVQEFEGKYAAGHEDAVGVARVCHELQLAERRHLERLVKHRRCALALNTAVGVRLFP